MTCTWRHVTWKFTHHLYAKSFFCSCKTLECSWWLLMRCYVIAKSFSPFFIYLWAAWDSICIFFPRINNSVCSLLVCSLTAVTSLLTCSDVVSADYIWFTLTWANTPRPPREASIWSVFIYFRRKKMGDWHHGLFM